MTKQAQQVNVNHDFVMSADADVLAQLMVLLGSSAKQVNKAQQRGVEHMRVVVGTKLANSAEHSTAYSAGTLSMTLDVEAPANTGADDDGVRFNYEHDEAQHAEHADAQRASAVKSAKAWLHELFNKRNADGSYASYTLAELCALTGKTEVNVRTMLSDLRSVKYAGKYGVLNTRSVRVNNVTRYSL